MAAIDGSASPPVFASGAGFEKRRIGLLLITAATAVLIATVVVQLLRAFGVVSFGYPSWRPVLFTFIGWSVCLGIAQVLIRGEAGRRALFILPAILFTVALVIFPTLFAIVSAFTNWNLSNLTGPQFNGLDNLTRMLSDPYFWNALTNMGFYLAAVIAQYALAFGLALLLNQEIRARKFFRVAFLLPFMLSPVAVSWMIGKSMMDLRVGPISHFMRWLGWNSPSFFTTPWAARLTVAALDAWVWIPFSVVLLLAGLQAIPRELKEASTIDGAGPWQSFWQITFPLMLPVSFTAVLVRVIFQLKLADIVLNTTYGGPGGASDTVSSYIFREYRDRSNIGYGSMMAMVYLICIVIFLTLLINLSGRFLRHVEQ